MRLPDFFIAGAPKCGTTALYAYLRGHPQVFMPGKKEPHFFGTDLDAPYFVRDAAAYEALFTGARPDQRVGEASVWYLYSTRAAAEIEAAAPGAQFIVMLRNPVEMVYSYHGQRLYNGTENESEFESALRLEPERRQGLRLPPHLGHAHGLMYSRIARYGEQLERLFAQVGRERVKVLLYDDFRARTGEVFGEVLRFLRVDDGYRPPLDVVNASHRRRSSALFALLHHPPRPIRAAVTTLVPAPLLRQLRGRLVKLNTVPHRRPPVSPGAAGLLREAYRDDVARLSGLLQRDLVKLWRF